MKFEDKFFVAAAILGLLLIGGLLVWEIRHPRTRWEESTCSECAQNIYLPDADGNVLPLCIAYEDVPCQVCAERAP